jgi:hypothetical protein
MMIDLDYIRHIERELGVELQQARKLAGYYNSCAPFFGLPSLPPVLLGK